MKQEVENIIKKNLPEPAKGIEKVIENTEQDRIYNLLNENMVIGFNQSLSQIDTSLIADEVFKVVRQIIEDKIKFQKKVVPSSYEAGYTHALEDLLSNLSTNKENEIIHKNCGTKSCKGEYKDGVVDYLCKKCDCTFLDNDEQTIIS